MHDTLSISRGVEVIKDLEGRLSWMGRVITRFLEEVERGGRAANGRHDAQFGDRGRGREPGEQVPLEAGGGRRTGLCRISQGTGFAHTMTFTQSASRT